ncbi:carbonic anhydrase family protein [Streptomyces sp. MB09-02B]|uniref:carbonic anhydrase family protein n=1 Tax=Streptomyces sp. MB09-02B TaxID=3028667 RepID=UPI0029A55EDC|nr:carbonic anhydrase family protein [Streptomyces sp. MB09-02B]MDX3640438.1 carbonic anhydrase family protein [Streptomyces sp. MB09-02B]
MTQTAPASSAVCRSHGKQSPVDIRPQDVDLSALPPLRFAHPTALDLELHFDDPDNHQPDNHRPDSHCPETRPDPHRPGSHQPETHRPETGLARTGRPDCVRDDEGTVKAVPPPGEECLVRVGADRYELVDVHWHTPSEHTVGGVAFPMEQHMKYRRLPDGAGAAPVGEDSGFAVVGVLVHPGQANGSLDRLVTSARRSAETWEVPGVELDALLPSCTESYRYLGSTTVCPYTPGVRWILLTHPVQASATALAHYRKVFPRGNARAVQPLGDRRVAGDRHRWW